MKNEGFAIITRRLLAVAFVAAGALLSVTPTPAQPPVSPGDSGQTVNGSPVKFEGPTRGFLRQATAWPPVAAAPTSAPPAINDVLPQDNSSYVPINTNLTFSAQSTTGISSSGIKLVVNGVDQSANLVITGSASNRVCAYHGPFDPNIIYNLDVTVTDTSGQESALSSRFDTFRQDNFTFEAEDFNFENGKFFDSYVLTSAESPDNYINKVGVPGVDKNNPTEGGAQHVYRGYDAASGVGETVGTEINGDVLRQQYLEAQGVDPAVADYSLSGVDVGEWWNYTRSFPSGTYKVYARLARDGYHQFSVGLSKVTSDPAASDQSTVAVGQFLGLGTGPGQIYRFFPLVDAQGNDVVLRFNGKDTLRSTLLAGGINPSFYLLAPASATGPLKAYVARVNPVVGSTGVSPDQTITALITDRDTKVVPNTIKLFLNEKEVPATVTPMSGGATVSYAQSDYFPFNSTNTVRMQFSDDATPANAQTLEWSFIVVGSLPTLKEEWALPLNSGNTRGFTARVAQTGVQPSGADNNTAYSEDTLSGRYPLVAAGLDAPQVINYWDNGGMGNFANPEANFRTSFPALVSGHWFAMEIVAYLDLKRGIYNLGVNSDDGFRLSAGATPNVAPPVPTASAADAVVIAEFSGGRSVGNTESRFLVSKDGLYPFRLTYEEGSDTYAVELYQVNADGSRTLVNDPDATVAVKAYRFNSALSTTVTITSQPTNVTTSASSTATFSVVAVSGSVTNPAVFAYQWQANGQDIAGANSASYTTPYLTTANNGTQYRCRILLLGFPEITSQAATLTVTPDTVPPIVAKVEGSGSFDTVTVTFDELVSSLTATNLGSYRLPGLTISQAVIVDADPLTGAGTKVVLATSQQTPGAQYALTVNGVTDLSGNGIAANTTVNFQGWVMASGFAVVEFYGNIAGLLVEDLTDSVNYLNQAPDRTFAVYSAETPSNVAENYGQKMFGLISPPTTGDYIFYLATDDSGELWLSTDDSPGNVGAAPIATVPGSAGPREWDQYPEQQSPPIYLEADQKYYFMVLQKEGTGSDNLAVGWVLAGGPTNINVIPAQNLYGYVNPDPASVTITQQPASVTVLENLTATFTVAASGVSAFSTNQAVGYQWQKNGVDIEGATGASYTIPPAALADNGAKFQCVCKVPGLSKTSAEAALTVQPDVAVPTLSYAKTAGALVLTFVGTLQSADQVTGVFSDVPGATSPFTAPATVGQKYYRARK